MPKYTATVEVVQYEHGVTVYPGLQYCCGTHGHIDIPGEGDVKIEDKDYIVKFSDGTLRIFKKDLFEANFKKNENECRCTRCESARAGHYVKGIDDYYRDEEDENKKTD